MKWWSLVFVVVCSHHIHAVLSSPLKTSDPPRIRHNHKIKRLREHLDRTILKQRTDHIYLENVQSDLEKLRAKFEDVNEETRREMAILVEDVRSARTPTRLVDSSTPGFTPPENAEVGNEAHDALRRDFLHLKSQMEALKSECQSSGGSKGRVLREESAISWLLQVVPDLQKSVRDIQESANLLQELHNKKDVDLRIAAVTADVANVEESLVKMTTRIEASAAISQSLIQELAENSGKLHRLQTRTAITAEKLDEETETVDNILRNLPDGFLQKKTFSLVSQETRLRAGVTQLKDREIRDKFEKLELKTSSIDFALMNLQKKIFLKETKYLGKEEGNADLGVMSDRLEEVEDQVAKIKQSTTTLIQIVSEEERKDERGDAKIRQTLAQFRSGLDKEQRDREASDTSQASGQKELRQEEHTDIYEFKRILKSLSSRIANIESPQVVVHPPIDDPPHSHEFYSTNQRLARLEDLLEDKRTRRKRRHPPSY